LLLALEFLLADAGENGMFLTHLSKAHTHMSKAQASAILNPKPRTPASVLDIASGATVLEGINSSTSASVAPSIVEASASPGK
jgi:hypothetical protein